MQAKAVVADRSAVHQHRHAHQVAMAHNLALGVLVRGGFLPDTFHRQLDQLEADAVIRAQ